MKHPQCLQNMKRCLVVCCLWIPLVTASDSDALGSARQLFARYVALGDAFDSELASLYADDAIIKNRRLYPSGEVREVQLPAPVYRGLIRSTMLLAQLRGDRSRYSNVSYTVEEEVVRIAGTRYSVLKKYSSPFILRVAPSQSGHWLIIEEITESRP